MRRVSRRLTLRSVCDQTHRPAQWVIVDDGSSDGTRELAESWAEREPWITVIGPERFVVNENQSVSFPQIFA